GPERLFRSSEDKRRVLAAESDAVGDGIFHVHAAPGIRNVVEVALRIRDFDVDRRRQYAVAHGEQRGGHTCGATSSLRMSDQALERGSRQTVGVFSKRKFYGSRLDPV